MHIMAPCISMEIDSGLKDIALHRFGYIIRNALGDALMKANTWSKNVLIAYENCVECGTCRIAWGRGSATCEQSSAMDKS
jgi:hypothetical protein